MVLTSAISVGGQLLKRSFDDNNGFGFGSSAYQGNNPPPTTNEPLPVLAQVQVLINFLLFLPLILYISYTLSSIFPTLAAIEDPLPAYEAIPIADPSFQPPQQVGKADNKKSSSPAINLNADLESSSASSSSAAVYRLAPITSSLRRTHRLLTSLNASSRFTFIRSCFRGLPFALISQIPAIVVALPLTQLTQLPRLIHLFVLLIFTHLNTAWVHIIITPPSSVRSWRRIPPFRRTLVATYIPVLFFWAALHSSAVIPYIISMPFLTPKDPEQPRTPAQQLTIALVSLIASVASLVSLLPAQVALLRVQASLLPEDQETIVPFDRSFGGRVAPQIVTGKGFPGVKAALASVTWPSWKRIIWQQVKLVGASGVLIFGVVLVAGLQVLVWKH